MTKALTVKRIERIEKENAPSARQEIADGLLVGLYLVRQPSKALSWAVRFRHHGMTRKLTLGAYPAINLEAARDLGAKALRAAAEGRDPCAEKQNAKVEAKRQAAEKARGELDLYENVARLFVKRHAKKNNRTWAETARILGFKQSPESEDGLEEVKDSDVMLAFRGRRIQEIERREINALLNKIADRAPYMSNRTFSAVRRLCTWSVDEDILQVSPCAGIKPKAKEKARDRVLTDADLKLVWNAASLDEGPFGSITKLLILTGQRAGEVSGMHRDEIDLDARLWKLPSSRTKNQRPHEVPLSDAAVAIIEKVPRIASKGLLFGNDRDFAFQGFHGAKFRLDAAIAKANDGKPIPAWTIHDLRRTAATGIANIGVAPHIVEAILNHISGHKAGVAGVYNHAQYAKEKAAALALWAVHIETVLTGAKPKGNVVPMRGAR
jgi:integrase